MIKDPNLKEFAEMSDYRNKPKLLEAIKIIDGDPKDDLLFSETTFNHPLTLIRKLEGVSPNPDTVGTRVSIEYANALKYVAEHVEEYFSGISQNHDGYMVALDHKNMTAMAKLIEATVAFRETAKHADISIKQDNREVSLVFTGVRDAEKFRKAVGENFDDVKVTNGILNKEEITLTMPRGVVLDIVKGAFNQPELLEKIRTYLNSNETELKQLGKAFPGIVRLGTEKEEPSKLRLGTEKGETPPKPTLATPEEPSIGKVLVNAAQDLYRKTPCTPPEGGPENTRRIRFSGGTDRGPVR